MFDYHAFTCSSDCSTFSHLPLFSAIPMCTLYCIVYCIYICIVNIFYFFTPHPALSHRPPLPMPMLTARTDYHISGRYLNPNIMHLPQYHVSKNVFLNVNQKGLRELSQPEHYALAPVSLSQYLRNWVT